MSNTATQEVIESLIAEAIQNATDRNYIYGSSRTIDAGFVRVIRAAGCGFGGTKAHWRAEFNTPDGKRTSRAKFAQGVR